MRLNRFAAGSAAAAAVAGCSLSREGLAPEDVRGDDAGVDAQITATFDAVSAPGDSGITSLCNDAGMLFCDDFENGPSAWTAQTMGGTVAIDGARAYRGAYSLHAQTSSVPAQNTPQLVAAFKHKPSQAWPFPMFFRMFVYLRSPVPPSIGALVDMLESASPYPGFQLNFRPPDGFIGATGYNGLDTDWSSSNDLLPTDSWVCVELEVEGPPTNVVHVFLAGTELPAMQHALPAAVPPIGVLEVGLSFFRASAQPQADMWIDEVAVDGARIGCGR